MLQESFFFYLNLENQRTNLKEVREKRWNDLNWSANIKLSIHRIESSLGFGLLLLLFFFFFLPKILLVSTLHFFILNVSLVVLDSYYRIPTSAYFFVCDCDLFFFIFSSCCFCCFFNSALAKVAALKRKQTFITGMMDLVVRLVN